MGAVLISTFQSLSGYGLLLFISYSISDSLIAFCREISSVRQPVESLYPFNRAVKVSIMDFCLLMISRSSFLHSKLHFSTYRSSTTVPTGIRLRYMQFCTILYFVQLFQSILFSSIFFLLGPFSKIKIWKPTSV